MSRNGAVEFIPPSHPSQIRSVVLVGPQGTGKSALIEQLVTGQLGHVKTAEDASHDIGARTALHAESGTIVHLVDTPGRPEFVGDVRAGLRAADAVLFVVAAGSGIDEATRLLWRECAAVGVPRAVAVTQLELARADWTHVVAECARVFGQAVPLGLPVLADGAMTGVLDLLEQIHHEADGSSRELTPAELERVEEPRNALIEAIIERSEDEGLLDRYLSGEELDVDGLRADLRTAVATGRFFPIVPVNPPTGAGVPALLDLMVHAFPSPDAAWLPAVMTPSGSDFGPLVADPAGPLVAQVIRTTTDPYVGRVSLVRIFSGTLRADARLHASGHLEWSVGRELVGHPSHDTNERIGQMTTPTSAGQPGIPRSQAIAGELVKVTKLSAAQTSDTLSEEDQPALVEPWLLPEPLLPVAIRAAAKKDEDKLAGALQRLISEDLTLRLERNAETAQLVLWTMGQAHLDLVLKQLADLNVEVETEEVRTSLRETFIQQATIQGRLVKQTGGHGQYAVVQLKVEPLPRGAGVEFVDKVVGGAVPRQYIPAVEKGARAQLEQGIFAGYPCIDVRVTLLDGKAHSVDSSDMAFANAAAQALREAGTEANVALLEPMDLVEITVADDCLGATLADLRSRRAQVQATLPAEVSGHTVITAEIPAHELARYPIDLRSVSHGSGSFTREFARYDYLPANLTREIVG